MTRDQFITLFFLALLAFVIYEIFHIFSPFFQAIFWAAILAFGFYPLYEWLRRKLGARDMLAAVLMTCFIFFVIIPPFVILIVNITSQAIELYQLATVYVRDGSFEDLLERIRSFGIIQKIENRLVQWEPFKQNAAEWVLNSSKFLVNLSVGQAGKITKNIFLLTFHAVMAVFLIFIFLKDGGKIYDFIYQIAPLEEKNKRAIFKQINGTFSAVIRGQILTGLTQAVVAGAMYAILGLPAPIFFAAVTFFASLIPVIGAVGIWLPLVVYLVTIHAYGKAAILALFGMLVISLIDNIMKPALIGEKTKLPYFLLFFGILGGLHIYGLMGLFLAPVILSLFFALVKIYQEKYA